jgi:hypothetical protein
VVEAGALMDASQLPLLISRSEKLTSPELQENMSGMTRERATDYPARVLLLKARNGSGVICSNGKALQGDREEISRLLQQLLFNEATRYIHFESLRPGR